MSYLFEEITIISGGQTGVDQAVLHFALDQRIPHGGWCPLGRINETGKIDERFILKETNTHLYSHRTYLNVRDSDATMIIMSTFDLDKGSYETKQYCLHLKKPLLIVNLSKKINIHNIRNWVKAGQITILNMAGPRESQSPGIFEETLQFLQIL